jgi:hypothetical protein
MAARFASVSQGCREWLQDKDGGLLGAACHFRKDDYLRIEKGASQEA